MYQHKYESKEICPKSKKKLKICIYMQNKAKKNWLCPSVIRICFLRRYFNDCAKQICKCY